MRCKETRDEHFRYAPDQRRVRAAAARISPLRHPACLGALADASLDISDVNNTALAAVRTASDPKTRLHLVDLNTGKATPLGVVGDGSPLVGMAIEP